MDRIPEFLQARFRAEYGDTADRVLAGLSVSRPVTLRVNTLKARTEEIERELISLGFSVRRAAFFQGALVLDGARESELVKLGMYERGEIYLQSLSSMLPPLLLNAAAGENVLDMAAAPGGKTCEIAALSGGQALVTACERDKIRFDRLKYNVAKQGAPRVNLLCTDALKLDDFLRFDKILLDAPCSGSGTIALGEPVKISPKLISNCAILQKNLLKKALKLLKKGGILVYSTCSVLKEENEEVLNAVLSGAGGEIVPIEGFDGVPALAGMAGTLTVCPSELYEGFFLAVIRKVR